jgi:hypothetical protein
VRRIRPVVLAIAILGLGLTQPANADHALASGHWGYSYNPAVGTDGVFDGNAQDAAYYWQDSGFTRGYVPPLPQYGQPCDLVTGWITACTVGRTSFSIDGDTTVATYSDGTIASSYTRVFNDLSDYRRQQVWRHEFGHALGLGHTSDLGCVMRSDADVAPGTRCQHDIDAIGLE